MTTSPRSTTPAPDTDGPLAAGDSEPIVVPDSAAPTPADPRLGPLVRRAVARRRVAVVATTSPAGRSHAATVLYQLAEGRLWIGTERSSRKVANIVANPWVAVAVPVRRLPLGPPASVQFQGRATVVDPDDPELRRLAGAGALKAVTGHGELDLPDVCFLRVEPPRRVPVYALGMSLWSFLRDPLTAGRVAEVDWS